MASAFSASGTPNCGAPAGLNARTRLAPTCRVLPLSSTPTKESASSLTFAAADASP